jgi:hypothetical protein
VFTRDDRTDPDFELPEDQIVFRVRSGLRWGGREPVMMPKLGMEVSGWYEASFRTEPGPYGYGGDRAMEPVCHQLWGHPMFTN